MKYFYFILLVLTSYTSSAQDPRFFENTWYLQNVIIDGQEHFPPSPNVEVPYVPLWINQTNYLETTVCDTGSGAIEFISMDSSFFFTQGMAMTLGNCYIPDNYPFQVLYFQDFFNSNYLTVEDIFQYEVTETGNDMLQLTLTSPRGDVAIYGDAIMAVNDNRKLDFTLSPNPASQQICLSSRASSGSIEIQIFNMVGKVYNNRLLSGNDNSSVDISNLPTGLYFLRIETESGEVEVKKFIKI